MKRLYPFVLPALLAVSIWNCGGDQASGKGAGTAESVNDGIMIEPTEFAEGAPQRQWPLSRLEEEVFANTGANIQWGGQVDNTARQDLSLAVSDQCGAGNCGRQVFLVNSNAERAVRAVLTMAFREVGSSGYLAREYTVPAGERLPIGCSHLCDGEDFIEFKRAIVEAVYQ